MDGVVSVGHRLQVVDILEKLISILEVERSSLMVRYQVVFGLVMSDGLLFLMV